MIVKNNRFQKNLLSTKNKLNHIIIKKTIMSLINSGKCYKIKKTKPKINLIRKVKCYLIKNNKYKWDINNSKKKKD